MARPASNIVPPAAAGPERPPLAPAGTTLQEWSFAERYPSLMTLTHNDPALRRQLTTHYDAVVAFCEQHVAPHALALEAAATADPAHLPAELLDAACKARLFSGMFPPLLGGGGLHFLAAFIGFEVVATHCVGVANLLGVNGLAIGCVLATFDPRALRLVAELVCNLERRGEAPFLATCVTEPGAGSDAEDAEEFEQAQIKTLATRCPGGYRLSGTKVFISNGVHAKLHVVAAFTDPRHRLQDLALFLVPGDADGLGITRAEYKLGQKICPANEVVFDDVFVPEAMRCRTAGAMGFSRFGLANVLGMTRAGVGAFATGVAEAAYRKACTAVRRLTWQGRPMETEQWVQFELAQMARQAQLARAAYIDALLAVCDAGMLQFLRGADKLRLPQALTASRGARRVRTALLDAPLADLAFKRLADRQTERQRDVACALGDAVKVSATDLANDNCRRAVALVGKEALRTDFGIEKLLRDVKLLQIYEGTNQINMLDFVKRRIQRQFDHA